MRLHAFALGMAIVVACGESLPLAADVPADGGVDATVSNDDGGATTDAGDANADAGCTTAPCNAVEVATASPRAMAASGSGLIWLDGETLLALDLGKAPRAVMRPFPGALASGFIALAGITAVMTQGSGVNRCNIDVMCADNPSAPIFGLGSAGPVAIADGEIYVADRAPPHDLATCGVAQGCAESAPVLAYLTSVATRIAVTSAFVVVGLENKTLQAFRRSERLDAGAPAPAALANVADLRGLAADGPDVYWTDGAGGTISRCRVDTCSSTKSDLLVGRPFPRAIAVQPGTAYWAETDDDAVLRCTLPACNDATVIARVARPTDLAVGDRVYVAAANDRLYAIDR